MDADRVSLLVPEDITYSTVIFYLLALHIGLKERVYEYTSYGVVVRVRASYTHI